MENPSAGIPTQRPTSVLLKKELELKTGSSDNRQGISHAQHLSSNAYASNQQKRPHDNRVSVNRLQATGTDAKRSLTFDSSIKLASSEFPLSQPTKGENFSVTPDYARKLFFKPLNKHSTREQVLQSLEKFGKVEYLRVPYSNKKKKNLGYGFVMFQSQKVSDFLCEHQIRTKIDDKIVGFSKFDIQKFKSKGHNSDKSLSEDDFVGNELNSLHNLRSGMIQIDAIDSKSHFVKPTSKRFYSIRRYRDFTKYKFNLEKLRTKELRDTKSRISISRLRSTREAL